MDKIIVAQIGNISIKIELKNTILAEKIWEKLPFKANVNTWGNEIYFEIPVTSAITKPVREVDEGDVAYWPIGRCLCFFFGPTPASKSNKPTAASDVEVVGKITSNLKELKKIRGGEEISLKSFQSTSK